MSNFVTIRSNEEFLHICGLIQLIPLQNLQSNVSKRENPKRGVEKFNQKRWVTCGGFGFHGWPVPMAP